jgi:hypothetical protein
LFELAAQDEVQSRLVIQDGDSWRLKHARLSGVLCLPSSSRAGPSWFKGSTCTRSWPMHWCRHFGLSQIAGWTIS